MSRAYLRLDPGFFERKAIDQDYPLAAVAALIGCLCLAEHQPTRGVFRDERLLRVLLGPAGKHVAYLIARGDLIREGSKLLVDGWDIWQEGDVTVADRVARFRNRHANGARNGSTNGVDNAVDNDLATRALRAAEAVGGKQSGGERPLQGTDQPATFMGFRRKMTDAEKAEDQRRLADVKRQADEEWLKHHPGWKPG